MLNWQIKFKHKEAGSIFHFESNDRHYDNTIDLSTRISHQHRPIFNRSETKSTNKQMPRPWHRLTPSDITMYRVVGKTNFPFHSPRFLPLSFSPILSTVIFPHSHQVFLFKRSQNTRQIEESTFRDSLHSSREWHRCWNDSRMSAVSSRGTN